MKNEFAKPMKLTPYRLETVSSYFNKTNKQMFICVYRIEYSIIQNDIQMETVPYKIESLLL